MQNRQPHNSQSLHKQFPGVYRDFFAKCQKVASAPNSFLWAGEFSGFYEGGLLISQKLPFRVYVGFEYTSHNTVQIDSEYLAYEGEDGHFIGKPLDEQLIKNWKQFLENRFRNRKEFSGVNLHVLTEAPIGHGLGSNGALAAALAILISPQDDFESRFGLARRILSLSQSGYSSGISAYNALNPNREPIVYFGSDDNFSSYPISQICEAKTPLSWPIDFGLIYSGIQTNSQSVAIAAEHTIAELDSASQRTGDLIKNYSHPPFRKTFLDMLNMTTGLMANRFVQLFTQGLNDKVISDFFNTINQYQNLLHILDLTTKNANLIYRNIHTLANKEVNGAGSGVKISGIGKGGAMLFAVPFGYHRGEITEMVNRLRRKSGRKIWLDYASWLDGIGGEAGKIEQDIEAGLIHFFLNQNVLILELCYHGKRSKRIVTDECYRDLAAETDLMLDKTTGKILIAGKPLTSKELPSQKATVAILGKLLMADDLSLTNSDISDSYGTNRYDLQSKVVLPLKKQIKSITKKDLQLSVSGDSYSYFRLKLEPANLAIGILDKKI